jgi:hypothetical protein
MASAETITNLLDLSWIIGAKQTVIQARKRETFFTQLVFNPLMSIKPDPSGERGIRTELDKSGTEIPVQNVELVVINADTGPCKVIMREAIRAAFGRGRAESHGFLLGNADQYDTLGFSVLLKIGSGQIFFTLSFLEMNDGNRLALRKEFYGGNEFFSNLAKQGRRGNLLSSMFN